MVPGRSRPGTIIDSRSLCGPVDPSARYSGPMTAEAAADARVDEDGFVCLVSPDTYAGFVDEDWELDALLERFVEQCNLGSLFIAYPGPDHADDRLVIDPGAPRPTHALREIGGIVHVGAGGLWLTDYMQLTMAAQFSDSGPLANHAVRIPVAAGSLVTLAQDPGEESVFRLTWRDAGSEAPAPITAVPWFE